MRAETLLRELIQAGREQHGAPLPLLGSAAWDALPDGDRVKIAAICVAALAWLLTSDPAAIAEDLRAELAIRQQIADDEAAVLHLETARRTLRVIDTQDRIAASVAQLRRPRAGDYPGGAA